MKRVVRIFTMVYGEAFIRRYVEVALPSLLQPGNVPALLVDHDVTFSLYTTPDSVTTLKSAVMAALRAAGPVAAALPPLFEIEPVEIDDQFNEQMRQNPALYLSAFNRRLQATCLLKEISACIKADAVMIWCTADCFFGDGSIANLVGTARAHGVSVAALYIRVEEERFRALLAAEIGPIANDRLARLALESLHEVWRSTVRGGSRHLTYLFGHDVVPLTPRLFAVSYRVPGVYAARFDKSDLAYFMSSGDLRDWDSTWPQKLISERRFLCLGSTDLALCAELTPATTAHPAKYHELDDRLRTLVDTRDYQRRGTHNEVMRNFVIALRTDRDVTIEPY